MKAQISSPMRKSSTPTTWHKKRDDTFNSTSKRLEASWCNLSSPAPPGLWGVCVEFFRFLRGKCSLRLWWSGLWLCPWSAGSRTHPSCRYLYRNPPGVNLNLILDCKRQYFGPSPGSVPAVLTDALFSFVLVPPVALHHTVTSDHDVARLPERRHLSCWRVDDFSLRNSNKNICLHYNKFLLFNTKESVIGPGG